MGAMTTDIIATLGGVGLFLLGKIWLTDGLRGLAGRTLREALARFTRTPLSGAVTGALTTAAIQSSSATTVTAVGFVSAGLITFPQALGVIFGANIGTTITGWLVAILGFKLQLGTLALPLVFVGALLRLFGRTRLAMLGTALAGFSLLFIGIDAMRTGMAAFEGIVTPTSFPGDSLIGRFELVLIGIAITLVTQSSSAGVATALAALGVGAISLPQAAAMVIGMDVGTTFTAALAIIGGTTATRRTGLSHVIYNVLTGIMAFLLLGPYVALIAPWLARGDSQIALVAFHTGFNILGVILVLPLTRPFARLVIKLVPESGPRLTRRLDQQLLNDADAATDAIAGTLEELADEQFKALVKRLRQAKTGRVDLPEPRAIAEALSETRRFIDAVPSGDPASPRTRTIIAALHILDHLERLYHRCNQTGRLETLGHDHRLRRLAGLMGSLAGEAAQNTDAKPMEARLDHLRRILRWQRRVFRERLLLAASARRLSSEALLARLDALRWLHRVAYHLWRIEHHLVLMRDAGAPVPPLREAKVEVAED